MKEDEWAEKSQKAFGATSTALSAATSTLIPNGDTSMPNRIGVGWWWRCRTLLLLFFWCCYYRCCCCFRCCWCWGGNSFEFEFEFQSDERCLCGLGCGMSQVKDETSSKCQHGDMRVYVYMYICVCMFASVCHLLVHHTLIRLAGTPRRMSVDWNAYNIYICIDLFVLRLYVCIGNNGTSNAPHAVNELDVQIYFNIFSLHSWTLALLRGNSKRHITVKMAVSCG